MSQPFVRFEGGGKLQEVAQQGVAILRGDALGMELHPMHRQGAVGEAMMSPSSVLRGHVQHVGQGAAIDDERMIARRLEGVVEAAEHGAALVMDRAHLAVHGKRRADHVAAEHLADGLVAQAHAEQRPLA